MNATGALLLRALGVAVIGSCWAALALFVAARCVRGLVYENGSPWFSLFLVLTFSAVWFLRYATPLWEFRDHWRTLPRPERRVWTGYLLRCVLAVAATPLGIVAACGLRRDDSLLALPLEMGTFVGVAITVVGLFLKRPGIAPRGRP